MQKVRLDKLMLERGLVPSRERAISLILAGRVLANEQKLTKAGAAVAGDAIVRILGEEMPFVSRGGLKLRGALDRWDINLQNRMCLDVGASTGGFTDCMLQAGAVGVVAVDTGYGQMAMSIRNHERVRLLERTNARLLPAGALLDEFRPLQALLGANTTPDFLAMDVSFISATLVLPAIIGSLAMPGQRWAGNGVVLVKPQFEAGRQWVGKGGIVRDPEAHTLAVERVRAAIAELGGATVDVAESPITGAEGNREFLLLCRFG